MIKAATFLLTLLLSVNLVMSQRTMLNSSPGLVISYFGDALVGPGGKVGVDYPFIIKESRQAVPRKNGGFNLTQSSQLIGGAGLAYYVRPGDHSGAILQVEGGFRYLRNQSNLPPIAWRLDLNIGIAFARFFAAGGTPVDNGSFRSTITGTGAVMPSISLAIGQDVKLGSYYAPISWHIKPNLFLYRFFSSGSSSFLSVEIGIIFRGITLPQLPQKVTFSHS